MALPGVFPALASLGIVLVLILTRRVARLDERVIINGLQTRTRPTVRIVVFGFCLIAFVGSAVSAIVGQSVWIPICCGLVIAVVLYRAGSAADRTASREAGDHNG